MYAIVDIETTGGSANFDKITEVAIYKFDGEKIVDEFVSLINPERPIPFSISQLTGITNEMVVDQPKFYEIAKKIVEITEDCQFVAHNAHFDYNFIRREFEQLGFSYSKKMLCTVRLSRKAFPGFPSYSLGKLCDNLGISISARHRAAGDALATVEVFRRILQNEKLYEGITGAAKPLDLAQLHSRVNQDTLLTIPESTGVYHFYDENDKLFYVGKSKNIRDRVITHLRGKDRKALQIQQMLSYVGHETTGSELVALLLEAATIKKERPMLNAALKRTMQPYGIYSAYDEYGYIRLEITKNGKGKSHITSFARKADADAMLDILVKKYDLCRKLCGFYSISGACFEFSHEICKGACIGAEAPDIYNIRVMQAIKSVEQNFKNILVLDKGPDANTYSFVLAERGKTVGYGFWDKSEAILSPESLKDSMTKLGNDIDYIYIISHFLQKNKPIKVVNY